MSPAFSPFLPSIPAMSFSRGSLLNLLHLFRSLPLQHRYNDFRSKLEQSLDESTLPSTGDGDIDAALKVLQMEKEKEQEEQEEQDKDTTDKAGRPQAPVDKVRNAFEILVRNATEEFGFAARDVFNGVLRLPRARMRHARGVEKLGYDQLRELVLGLPRDCGSKSQFSDIVVVVYPRPSTSLSNYDDWVTDFKSIRIAKEAVEWLRLQGHGRLREMYNLFHRIPECSSLAGWVFEAIVHRMFVAGWQAPQPILMASDGGNPPVFSTDSPSSTSGTFLLPFAPLSAGTRAFTRIDFNDRRLSGVTLEPNTSNCGH
jgi:hypothetical protein